jgi:hypothetical protein
MLFNFSFSFSFSMSLSLGGRTTSDRHLDASVKENITRPASSQRKIRPARTVYAPAAASVPARPSLPGFARYLRNESISPSRQVLETKESHIIDTIRSRFLDRKGLRILLEASSQREKSTGVHDSIIRNSANDVSNALTIQHSPVAPVSTSPVDAFISDQSSADGDNSGSDLVSSLLGIRVGELSAYFQELDKWTIKSLSKAPSSAKHNMDPAAEEEMGQSPSTHGASDEDWEEVDVGETQRKKQCWKRHRCMNE